jgi:hypothetical protein
MGKLKALDPFLHDVTESIYNDPQVVEKLTNIITNKIEPPYSIAINGSWGEGKTTMMVLLRDVLNAKGYPTLWFNPWEYESTGDIIQSFFQQIAIQFTENYKINDIGIFAASFFTVGIDALSQFITNKVVSFKNIKEIVKDLESHDIRNYINCVETIKTDFVRLTKSIQHKYPSKPLIIFMDDLDRCLPENGIKLLETLKNLFVIKDANVIVITGIEISVAKKFIQKRYYELQPDIATSYFRKVFNLTVNIPALSNSRLREYLLKYIQDIFDQNEKWHQDKVESIIDFIIELSHASGMVSIRRILTVVNQFYVCYITNSICKELDSKLVLTLLFIEELWNSYFCEFSTIAQKYYHSTLEEVLQTEGYFEQIKKTENNLYLFLQKYCMKNISIKSLIEANLL